MKRLSEELGHLRDQFSAWLHGSGKFEVQAALEFERALKVAAGRAALMELGVAIANTDELDVAEIDGVKVLRFPVERARLPHFPMDGE